MSKIPQTPLLVPFLFLLLQKKGKEDKKTTSARPGRQADPWASPPTTKAQPARGWRHPLPLYGDREEREAPPQGRSEERRVGKEC